MKFIDEEHKKFFDENLNELIECKKTDIYYRSLIYTLRNM
ncbi:MAG: DUF6075 family protein [Clostridia bacterium]